MVFTSCIQRHLSLGFDMLSWGFGGRCTIVVFGNGEVSFVGAARAVRGDGGC